MPAYDLYRRKYGRETWVWLNDHRTIDVDFLTFAVESPCLICKSLCEDCIGICVCGGGGDEENSCLCQPYEINCKRKEMASSKFSEEHFLEGVHFPLHLLGASWNQEHTGGAH